MSNAHRKLKAWNEAVSLCKQIYLITENFPPQEIYSLTTQLRRAAISVGSNIAEGSARYANKEFIRFLNIARGSLAELDTQIYLAKELGYLKLHEADIIFYQIEFTSKLIAGLKNSLNTKL